MARDLLRCLTCGSVDDGKSTLIGRLLLDADGVYDDQRELDPALIMDGLTAEREQGITIDVAYRYFSSSRRSFIIADTPGHEQYTRNMVSGASTCDLAVLLVDARHGLRPQTRRHAAIAALLGIRHLVLVVNKMDLVAFAQSVYDTICADFRAFASKLTTVDVQCLPVAALAGDNVVHRSTSMPWYEGGTLLHLLESVQVATGRNTIDLRLPVQLVCRPRDGGRVYQGSVRSGTLRVGDDLVVLPSGTSVRVSAITGTHGATDVAMAPEAVTVALEAHVDVSRGDMLVPTRNRPHVGQHLDAMVVWMGDTPLKVGRRYRIKHLATTTGATLTGIDYRWHIDDLRRMPTDQLEINAFGRCQLVCDRPLMWDPYDRNRATGAFIVIDPVSYDTVGAGMLVDRLPETPPEHAGPQSAAAPAPRPAPVTVWFTGLSGSGKSTIAAEVERRLRAAGVPCLTLDGDVMRTGLNSDLGFTAADRRENVRRNAEVAKLFNQQGFIVLVPVIAPFIADRAQARAIIGPDHFHEVWVNAPLDVCETRDVKGLYKRARAGEVTEFTGVSSPYEPPSNPDLVVESSVLTVAEAADAVLSTLNPEPRTQNP